MKKSLAVMLALIMVLCMIPTAALAASNSAVVLHPSFNHTVTGVKVKVGDKIDGHPITKISVYDITVDLGKYNVIMVLSDFRMLKTFGKAWITTKSITYLGQAAAVIKDQREHPPCLQTARTRLITISRVRRPIRLLR